MLGDDAFDLPIFNELEVGVLLDQAHQLRLLGFTFSLWFLLLRLCLRLGGIVVFAHWIRISISKERLR
jgi:hypothetical protein